MLRPSHTRLLDEIRRAGPDGVLWTSCNATVAGALLRKGLIEYRLGTLAANKGRPENRPPVLRGRVVE
jgi:hypothetical protein